MDPYKIILMPWITEKSLEQRRVAAEEIGYFQNNNRLEFIVRREASKADIKAAVEELLEVRVAKVNTRITKEGKHASVKLAEGYDAEDRTQARSILIGGICMGKRIRAQRRGSSPKNRVNMQFPGANRLPRKDGEVGEVVDMIHSPVHTGPLAKLKFEDGTTGHVAATRRHVRRTKRSHSEKM